MTSMREATRTIDRATDSDAMGTISSPTFRLGRRPALDGMRALAVLAVFAGHAELPLAGGGHLGVDVFFVLSGFLITALLVEEHRETGTTSLRAFIARRARRLLPAFLVFAAATALIVGPNVTADQRRALFGGLLASLAYVRNWVQITRHTGLEGFTQPHLWSLAVEEQFYLVWPLVFLVLSRIRGARNLLVPFAGLFAASTALGLFLSNSKADRVSLGTDVRAVQMLAGAIVAVLLTSGLAMRLPTTLGPLPLDLLLGLAIVGVVLLDSVLKDRFIREFYLRGGIALFGTLVAAFLLMLLRTPDSAVNRALAIRPLVFVGAISYSVYLWHALVITLVTPSSVVKLGLFHVQNSAARVVAMLVGTLGIAALSTFTVERWCQRHFFQWADRRHAKPSGLPVVSTHP